MYEIVATAIQTLLSLVEKWTKVRKEEIKKDFGEALGAVYFRLIDCVNTGERLLNLVEVVLEKSDIANSSAKNQALHLLHDHVNEQLLNLRRLENALQRVNKELQILLPETQSVLDFVLYTKGYDLQHLSTAMEKGFVGFELSRGGEESMTSGLISLRHFDVSDQNRREGNVLMYPDAIFFTPNALSNKNWENYIAPLRSYLASGLPQRRVGELRESVSRLRKVILENFELSEILDCVSRGSDIESCG